MTHPEFTNMRLEQAFYGAEDNKDCKRMKPVNKAYLDKVRKAMNITPE